MRTYGSRSRTIAPASPSTSDHEEPAEPALTSSSRKRPLEETESNTRSTKRTKTTAQARHKSKSSDKLKQKSLTQLHFCVDQSVLRRCPLCDLCFTKGAADDLALHKAHCNRVQKGMEWSKEEDREGYGTTITEVKSRVRLGSGRTGRIVCFPADIGGKIGSKLSALLQTVNLCLSSPPLSKPALQASKIYLFLLPQESSSKSERIVGCVIAQRIETAMDVIPPSSDESHDAQERSSTGIEVGGVFCNPQRHPTPMGISRLFVPSTQRRQGIARSLLSAAAETFIPGCHLDPLQSQIAFSQPTGDGNKVMQSFGGGRVRIYEED